MADDPVWIGEAQSCGVVEIPDSDSVDGGDALLVETDQGEFLIGLEDRAVGSALSMSAEALGRAAVRGESATSDNGDSDD